MCSTFDGATGDTLNFIVHISETVQFIIIIYYTHSGNTVLLRFRYESGINPNIDYSHFGHARYTVRHK